MDRNSSHGGSSTTKTNDTKTFQSANAFENVKVSVANPGIKNKVKYDNGDSYEGAFNKKGNFDGIGVYEKDGVRYKCLFSNGRALGESVITYPDGTVCNCAINRDFTKKGEGKVQFKNGSTLFCVFSNDRIDPGRINRYVFPNGDSFYGTFVIRDGISGGAGRTARGPVVESMTGKLSIANTKGNKNIEQIKGKFEPTNENSYKPSGPVKVKYSNGDLYVGTIDEKFNKNDPRGKIISAGTGLFIKKGKGNVVEGKFYNDKLEGEAQFSFNNSGQYKVNYSGGIMDSEDKIRIENAEKEKAKIANKKSTEKNIIEASAKPQKAKSAEEIKKLTMELMEKNKDIVINGMLQGQMFDRIVPAYISIANSSKDSANLPSVANAPVEESKKITGFQKGLSEQLLTNYDPSVVGQFFLKQIEKNTYDKSDFDDVKRLTNALRNRKANPEKTDNSEICDCINQVAMNAARTKYNREKEGNNFDAAYADSIGKLNTYVHPMGNIQKNADDHSNELNNILNLEKTRIAAEKNSRKAPGEKRIHVADATKGVAFNELSENFKNAVKLCDSRFESIDEVQGKKTLEEVMKETQKTSSRRIQEITSWKQKIVLSETQQGSNTPSPH